MFPYRNALVLLAGCFMLLSGCAGGRTAYSKGERLEKAGNLDEAVVKYAQAAMANPGVHEYRLRYLKACEEASRMHFDKGEAFLARKDFTNAFREYQTAVALDPAFERARQQVVAVQKMRDADQYFAEGRELEKKRKLREAFRAYRKAQQLDPARREIRNAVQAMLKSRRPKLDGFELNLKSTKPITLKFRDTRVKDVFNIVTQLSGINFIFDDGVKDQNITIYLQNATFQQAMEVITSLTKLGRKVLNESTILIYPKTPEKIKQYEELVVRTFFLNSMDAKKAVNLLRTMLQVKKVYVNEELNAIVIRDVPETVDVAQRILEANDLTESEVVLEVEVIEVTRTNAEQFGLALSKYAVSMNTYTPQNGFLSDTFNAATTSSITGTAVNVSGTQPSNLLQTFAWRGFGGFITVPSASYNFGKTLSSADTLANPKIRVKNREKAKFNVGTRVPITTTSTTGTTGGFAVNVQYVDVGVKLNAEPTIQLNDEITLKLSLEVSQNLGQSTVAEGTTVVTIGTRNLDTVLSLKDGETSIIGGLIQDSKNTDKKKISILGDLPLIGPLLSNRNDTNNKTELVLAITPRVVRSTLTPEGDEATIWSGREDDPSLTSPYSAFAEEPEFPAEPAAPAFQPPTQPPAPPAAESAPPAAVPPPPASLPPVQPVSPEASSQSQQTAAAVNLSIAAPASVAVGGQFNAEIRVSGASDLARTPFKLAFDPASLEFVGALEGSFLKQGGAKTDFRTALDRQTGTLDVTMGRAPGTGGAGGSGTLATILFKPRKQGYAGLGLQATTFSGASGTPVEVIPYSSAVEVR